VKMPETVSTRMTRRRLRSLHGLIPASTSIWGRVAAPPRRWMASAMRRSLATAEGLVPEQELTLEQLLAAVLAEQCHCCVLVQIACRDGYSFLLFVDEVDWLRG
jgi:hypothetical protein